MDTNNLLQNVVANSPIVQAAITEAIHRFYFDRIGSNNKQEVQYLIETEVFDILQTLHLLNPNWRYILNHAAKRYADEGNTNRNLLISKPKKIRGLKLNFEIK